MKTRRCDTCVYAGPMHDGRRTVLICANTPEAPGQIVRIKGSGTCRNFRRRRVVVRPAPARPPDEEIRYIPLTKGKVAIVDAADYEWLSRYKWHVEEPGPGRFYASRATPGHARIGMHRAIMNPPKGMVVDHINGNGLDNRRCNLRICTPRQNSCNRSKHRHTKHRFIGVQPCGKNTYQATIMHKGKTHRGGTFTDEVEAAKARDRLALKLHGPYARLNFPELREEGEPDH